MMSDKTCIVIDHGIFLPIARKLGEKFGKVYYHTPMERAFPTVRDIIGDGFEEIEWVESPWSVMDKVDFAIFPDIGFSAEQETVRALGIPSWGARFGDKVEWSRGTFLETLLDTGLPMPKYEKIVGLNKLRDYLKDKEDKWIKASKYRGDIETFHWRDWAHDESKLDVIAVRLGPWKEAFSFYVFDPIDTHIEDGADTWNIDGQFPKTIIHGMERKDAAFIGTFQAYADLPKEVRIVLDAFGPVLEKYGYRSFFSAEVRITDEGDSYFIDPTCRAGSPPSQAETELVSNLSEIIENGANGRLVEPEPSAKFGVQATIEVKGDRKKDYVVMDVPSEIDQWVKCGMCSHIDGRLVFPPDPDANGNDIGWLVALGDTIKEAVEHLQEYSKALPDGFACDTSRLGELLGEVQEAEGKGMEFSDQPIPDPKIVVDKA